jgi:hypothetical protein
VRIRRGLSGITARCTISGKYNPDTPFGRTADYALCQPDQPIDLPLYETVAQTSGQLFVGGRLLLAGAGCTAWGVQSDQSLRAGLARIVALPSGQSNDIVTDWDGAHSTGGEGAALCPGDSGGAAYAVADVTRIEGRAIAGVNSRTRAECLQGQTANGDCVNDAAILSGLSFVSSLTSADGRAFLAHWTQMTGELVCGVNTDGARCRGFEPPG